jgi:Bacteriophage tail sheath protein
MTAAYITPGVYREDQLPAPEVGLVTGVPGFLGFVASEPLDAQQAPVRPQLLTRWVDFEQRFGPPLPGGYVGPAVRGFFENGGARCYVVALDAAAAPVAALSGGLEILAALDAVDLVCAPDIVRSRGDQAPPTSEVQALQTMILDHCHTAGDRFAILDAAPGLGVDAVQLQQEQLSSTPGASYGALYYPWVGIPTGPPVPPCGHVAGVYATTDQQVGVHKAPANSPLEGVVDLQVNLTNAQQGPLNQGGVNCLRAFPGRGIRVWGARTLSHDPAWRYVNVRRLFLTAGRWIEQNLVQSVLEPNDQRLWAQIERTLGVHFTSLARTGALQEGTAGVAFYVKCDADTNPPAVRDMGEVVTEIGLAPTLPSEFIVVRIVLSSGGITITGPGLPA